jgi:hypothetical protein
MPKTQPSSMPPRKWKSSLPKMTIKIPMPANVKPPKEEPAQSSER